MHNRYLRDRARRRTRRGRPRDRMMDHRRDYEPVYMQPTHYEVGHYLYDGADMDTEEYHRDLEEWMRNLKHKDHFGLSKDEVIRKAHEMGVKFHEYDEAEFYITYLMMVSDFKHVPNDPHQYLVMAKEWLEDDDAGRRGSEKLCAYYYSIVLGED